MASAIKESISFVWELIKIIVLALIIVVLIRHFLFKPFVIEGSSMEPNFHDGDYLIINELSYRFSQPQRGQVVVFYYPLDTDKRFIKRIIGLPGETIQANNNKIYITKGDKTTELDESKYLPENIHTPNFGPITIPDGYYFVLGDNREFSSDSHEWGVLPRSDIIGSVLLRLWPLKEIAIIQTPQYLLAP